MKSINMFFEGEPTVEKDESITGVEMSMGAGYLIAQSFIQARNMVREAVPEFEGDIRDFIYKVIVPLAETCLEEEEEK